MTSGWIGLWHVRGGPLATLALAVGLAVTVVFPDISVGVSAVFGNPPRGVGTPEIVAITLAAILPALTAPAFDGREILAHPGARAAHTAFTIAATTAPLLVLPVWSATITTRFHETNQPPLLGLLGSILFYCCSASLLCLLVGGPLTVVLTPTAFIALLVAQQAFPTSILASWLATGRNWHTNWWLTTAAAGLLLTLSWHSRSVPLHNHR